MIIQRVLVKKGDTAKEALIDWMPQLPKGVEWTTFIAEVADRSIPSNGSLKLLELKGDDRRSGIRARA